MPLLRRSQSTWTRDTHASICPRAERVQVNQHQPLLHAISCTRKRLWIPYQVESGEPCTADRNLRMDVFVKRGGLRDAPNREYRDKSWTSSTPTYKRTYTCEEAGRPLRTSCLYLRGVQAQTLRSSGTSAFRQREPQTCHFRDGKLLLRRLSCCFLI